MSSTATDTANSASQSSGSGLANLKSSLVSKVRPTLSGPSVT